MSDTPRTDAASFAVVSNDPKSVVVWADFARRLERDNAALREENLKLRKVIHDQGDEIRTLHIFNAAGAAIDAARAEEGQSWGIDEIIRQHLREGGTPT